MSILYQIQSNANIGYFLTEQNGKLALTNDNSSPYTYWYFLNPYIDSLNYYFENPEYRGTHAIINSVSGKAITYGNSDTLELILFSSGWAGFYWKIIKAIDYVVIASWNNPYTKLKANRYCYNLSNQSVIMRPSALIDQGKDENEKEFKWRLVFKYNNPKL
ncbi:13504_t:CDS:1 [Ambispora leptoticha]|uniref:13504_t:CDS:1 n=1 Tax=Ambispora leptoticha TaxID=144679 RepID=A0A9N9EQ04_9GLOM|nr:13504_t:CDS:1 [Ambispora leptoticha]